MFSDRYLENLTASFFSLESWAKVLFLIVTAPAWFPIFRAMLNEVREVLAPEGGLYASNKPRPIARRPRGEDPFLNIPYAEYRAQQRSRSSRDATQAASTGRAQRTPNASSRRPALRRRR